MNMEEFYEGYDTFSHVFSSKMSADMGYENIEEIEDAIVQMTNNINNPSRSVTNASIDSLKGFVAEWWHDGTYNVDSAVKGNNTFAQAPYLL